MATTIEERNLRFKFDDAWTVAKYDDHKDYRNKIERLNGTKALDFVAVRGQKSLFFIEVKDFRGYRIENKTRMRDSDLALEVAEKVRDTIAGIIGAQHRGNKEDWEAVVACMIACEPPVRVLLWLEDDLPPTPRARRCNQFSVLSDSLKRHLHWLSPRVFVVNSTLGGVPEGLIVENLPGAGRAI